MSRETLWLRVANYLACFDFSYAFKIAVVKSVVSGNHKINTFIAAEFPGLATAMTSMGVFLCRLKFTWFAVDSNKSREIFQFHPRRQNITITVFTSIMIAPQKFVVKIRLFYFPRNNRTLNVLQPHVVCGRSLMTMVVLTLVSSSVKAGMATSSPRTY